MENTRNDINGLTKEHTLILKGILVLMLLFHHLFFPDKLEAYTVNTFVKNPATMLSIVTWCKSCIAGFCFITAYGTTKKFMNMPRTDTKSYAGVVAISLIKLEMSVWFIYVLAVLYKKLVMRMNLDYGSNPVQKIIYMIFDALGLAKYTGTPTINVTWWYLSLFILLIVSMPFIYHAYTKGRYLLLGPACLLPAVLFSKSDLLYADLLPVVVIGVAFAYENWFEKIEKWNRSWRKLILLAALILCGWFSFEVNRYVHYTICWMLIFFLPILVQEYLSHIPGLSHILKFIGAQATSIFLIHTFIYYYFYTDILYSLSDSWKIYLALLTSSILVSLIIAFLKKRLQYDRLTVLVQRKLSFWYIDTE